ncbi:MAG: tryptophan synthase subunit alpha [Staphylococcus lugdunensis]|nr:tryptophan synthase subunit alpha [Staphylococcus lugdunensis]
MHNKLFIPYVMGDKDFIQHVKLLSEHGADYIEIGVPFSDPVADGPIIMKAANQAIKDNVTIDTIFEQLKQNQHQIKANYILMTYYNIVMTYGIEAFFKSCEEAGVYGLIIPDLPFELTEKLKEQVTNYSVKIISLVAMTAPEERIREIATHAEGFIYTVTMNAVTGQNESFHPELKQKLALLKSITQIPVVCGFGIRTPEQVSEIIQYADGVFIGSEIVKRLKSQSQEDIITYINSIRQRLSSQFD